MRRSSGAANVGLTVKLSRDDVAWLDAEVARRTGEGLDRSGWRRPPKVTRSSIVRELVEAQRSSLFPPVKSKKR